MKDIVITELLKAKNKGALSRLDVLIRYFRMKYRLVITRAFLVKRIKNIKSVTQ